MSAETSEECFSFASFRLYPGQRTLLHKGQAITIGGRAFDVLLHLVARAGTVVSLAELMQKVWPSVTVEEANLRVQMGILRKVLSHFEEGQRAVETIPLRGYCFILPVRHHPHGMSPAGQTRATRAELPTLLTALVGREEAIDLLSAALAERRLVTITGPGGVGKTVVAVATAARHAAQMNGATGFVDLSGASDARSAAAIIADRLGIEVAPDASPLAALCADLRQRDMLLVLDTCEHIVEEMAGLAETLLASCFNLRLLVTSREALRAVGEWTHRLTCLPCPDRDEPLSEATIARFPAMALFVERMRASTDGDLHPGDLAAIAQICRRLDGIPLALEFAAARVADLGLRAIVAGLDDGFGMLTRGRRTALPRHRSMFATLDWSYRLLSRGEQASLRHLATLPALFTAQDAAAQFERAGHDAAPGTLSSLYEKSLLAVDVQDAAPVYHLLGTTRAFVAGEEMAGLLYERELGCC